MLRGLRHGRNPGGKYKIPLIPEQLHRAHAALGVEGVAVAVGAQPLGRLQEVAEGGLGAPARRGVVGGQVEVSVWLAGDEDVEAAIGSLQQIEGVTAVEVAELASDGVRLSVAAWAQSPAARGSVAARLRRESLRRLRGEALS